MWFLAGIAAKPAHSGVIYTYTGNQFNDFRNGGSCPPTCNVTGSFVVAQPLPANLPETIITPLSFSITAGSTTLTDGEPADTVLWVTTDASSMISTWSWQVVGPAANPSARILTQNVPRAVFDSVRFGNQPPPLVGPIAALIQDDAGTWSVQTPEPGGCLLIGGGMLAILSLRRRNARLPM
jgi:hypothetical protein